ncbi:MAG: carbohydrate kinase family protein [Planctomycetota bacterium]
MSTTPIDVIVAGHICLDITPDFSSVTGSSVGEVLRPGKLLEVGAPTISTGGAVSNTGLALRRLGLNVSLMGRCGTDQLGDMLLDVLAEEAPGAGDGMSVSDNAQTSYSVVLAIPGIDRIFLHCPGCNDTFGPGDIDSTLLSRARILHFGYPPLMRRMYESEGKELERILHNASNAGTATSLDMALPDPDSDAGRADWPSILSRILPHTDVFLPSLEELLFMLDRSRFQALSESAGGITDNFLPEDVRRAAGQCLEMGARIVVVKCGHVGAYLRTREQPGEVKNCLGSPDDWRAVEIFEPTCQVKTVASATGAGDSSISGFLAAMLRGEDPRWCMASLATVGAQNLSAIDAVSGVRSWEETVRHIEAGPPKNPLPDRLHDAF